MDLNALMKICPNCGYLWRPEESSCIFDNCKGVKLIKTNIKQGRYLRSIAADKDVLTKEQLAEKMQEIYQNSDVEIANQQAYNLIEEYADKTERYLQANPPKQIVLTQLHTPNKTSVSCPYCKSKNVKKLSTLNRSASFGLFGFGSKKIGKQWECKSCKSAF